MLTKKFAGNLGLLVLCLLVGGGVSLLLGQDANWDIKNYHLYNPFSLINGRFETDLYSAGIQTYFHPLLDVPYYWLSMGPLSANPALLAFLMGLPFGVVIFSVLKIANSICFSLYADPHAAKLASLTAVIFGVSGIATASQVGATFNEVPIAALMLAGLAVVFSELNRDRKRPVSSYVTAGLLFGAAAGMKLTAAIYAPAIAIAILFTGKTLKVSIITAFYFCCGWLASFSVLWGWWAWKLFKLTGSPMFPMFNDIFHSPWISGGTGMDERFKPDSLFKAIFYPFYWLKNGPMTVAEPHFTDPRFALAFVSLLLIMAVVIFRKIASRTGLPTAKVEPNPSVRFVLIFVPLAYVIWESLFSIIRYAVVIECLTGVILLILIGEIYKRFKFMRGSVTLVLLFMLILALVKGSTAYPEWGRVPYSNKVFEFTEVDLPSGSLVLLASKPIAYAAAFIGQKNPDARFIGLVDTAVESQQTLLHQKIAAEIKGQTGNIFVLSNPQDLEATERNLARYDLGITGGSCSAFSSNINHDLTLCALSVVDGSAQPEIDAASAAEEDILPNFDYLTSGWSQPEGWGVWSNGTTSTVSVPVSSGDESDMLLTFRSRAYLNPLHSKLNVQVYVNNVKVETFAYSYPQDSHDKRRTVNVPRQLISQRPQATEIRFEYDKPASPQSLGVSADSRQLGLGLIWLKLLPVGD